MLIALVGLPQTAEQDWDLGWEVWALLVFATLGPARAHEHPLVPLDPRIGPARATLAANLQPFVAAVLAVILLSEPLGLLQIARRRAHRAPGSSRPPPAASRRRRPRIGHMSEHDFMPIDGWDHLELWVGNAKQAAYFYEHAFGFTRTAYAGPETGVRDRASYVLEQGDIRFVLTSGLRADSEICSWAATQGRQRAATSRSPSPTRPNAYRQAVQRGARGVVEPHWVEDDHGRVELAAIATYGDNIHTFVNRSEYAGAVPARVPVASRRTARPARGVGLIAIDHVVGNVELGRMDEWVEFYERVLGFTQLTHFSDEDISTEYSALMSKVMTDGEGKIKFPINEPAEGKRKSQIEEYLEFHGGPGVQHVAHAVARTSSRPSPRCASTASSSSRRRTRTTTIVQERVGEIDENWDDLRSMGILADRDEEGYLLQLFTKIVQDRPTLFFEVIERHGSRGFGIGQLQVALRGDRARAGPPRQPLATAWRSPRRSTSAQGDADIAYQVIGDGPRDIVVVLDWASHLEALVEQPLHERSSFTALARFARVLWFDMRGVGMSGRSPERRAALEGWMDDLRRGHGRGGLRACDARRAGPSAAQMALMAAATHPERVDSLVLVNGCARFARADDYPAGLPEHMHEPYLDALEAAVGHGRRMRRARPVGRPTDRVSWSGGRGSSASARHRGRARDSCEAMLELDVRNVLPLVERPTLVVHSRDNAFVRVGHGRYLAEHIRGARLVERRQRRPLAAAGPGPARRDRGVRHRVAQRELGDADRVLATVLFVDVVGSTEYASELGDRSWRVALDRFEQVVRTALSASTTGGSSDIAGDGVLATFDGPARAIRCARRIRDEARRSGLEVRCGLHAGEVTRRAEGVAGIAVHIGARVSALAEPGEVLVTRTVRDLVAGSGIAFEERGEHELKGVPDRWALYAATG